MKPILLEERIQAPAATVFDVLAHIENYRLAVEDIVNVEFLTEARRGLGTTFRETRKMGKREATVEMEVVGYEPDTALRICSKPDSMGTVWDSRFTLTPEGHHTRLSLEMRAESSNLLAKLANTLFAKMIAKAVAKDFTNLKRYCEQQS